MNLSPQLMTDLSAAPRHEQARALLTVPDPLPREVCFSDGEAGMAYLAFLAYQRGRHAILKGRPGYEAAQMLASRIRSAATRAGSLEEWGHELMAGVGSRVDDLQMEDRLWWMSFLSVHDGIHHRRLLQPSCLSKVVTASELLRTWIYQIRDHATQVEVTA